MQVKYIENTSPKIRSIRTLKQWIQQGTLPTGEQLPPENELARLLKVSRTTVRAAVKAIEQEGLLQHSQNRRRVVVGTNQRNGGLVSDTIVILTHLADRPSGNPNPISQTGWESYIQIGLIDAVREAGMHALTLQLNLLDGDLIKRLIAERPRGLVVMRPTLHASASLELATALRSHGVPVVFYGFADSAAFDTVTSDHAAGCHALTKWLIENGRRRLLRVWPAPSEDEIPEWQRQRSLGYEQALAEAGLAPLPVLTFPNLWNPQAATRENFDMRVRLMVGYLFEFLKRPEPIDALIAITDGDCFALAAACRILGKDPNRDVSIVGYDNYWEDSPDRRWEAAPPVATVDKLNIQLGHEIMGLLNARLQGQLPPEPQFRLIKPRLEIIGDARR